jgi:hypothetical protein
LQNEHVKENIAYSNPERFPKDKAKSLKILVDPRHEAVILPIFSIATPFHISFIKNISQTEGEGYSTLRINFVTPTMTQLRDVEVWPDPMLWRGREGMGLWLVFGAAGQRACCARLDAWAGCRATKCLSRR